MNNKPNILIVTFEIGGKIAGGVGRVIDPLVSNFEGKIDFGIDFLKYNKAKSQWQSHILRKKGKGYKTILNGEYVSVLLKAIELGKYNIVHFSHIGVQIANCVLAIKAYFPEVRIVYSCHSIAKYEFNIRKNRETEVESEEKIVHNADHIHLLNNVSLKYFRSCYPEVIANTKYTFIPNGIRADEFKETSWLFRKRLALNIKRDDICIMCMSRWSYGKGIEYLVDAIPEILKYRKNIKFILAGRKKNSWENNVNKYVAFVDSKIKPYRKNIIKLGWLNYKEKNTLLAMADICVMPSLIEYLPYSILEPMINKVPIVSSRIDSVEVLLDENEECVFFNPEDSHDLAQRLLYLIDHAEVRNRLAENAYKKAVSAYTWDKIVKMYVDMYKSIFDEVLVHV